MRFLGPLLEWLSQYQVFSQTLLWYLAATVLGLATFPLVYRFLSALPGRGYTLSRTLGLFLWGFIFWLLGSYGLLKNDLGSMLVAFLILVGLGGWAWRQTDPGEITKWVKDNKMYVVVVEILFFAALVAMAYFRAMSPDIIATEKPMELAFINAIMRSPTMPPHDPWLADYAISYYYFGYILTSMLARVTAVTSGVAFNLMIAMVFSLAAVGAYGVVYNLLATSNAAERRKNMILALLAPLFVLILSNSEGALEILHMKGVGNWEQSEEGEWSSTQWEGLDIKNLEEPPLIVLYPDDESVDTSKFRFWWWWRASRVIQDRGMPPEDGSLPGDIEVIDEFPFFSFLLADLHPHVLAMPFVFLAVGLALQMFLSPDLGEMSLFNFRFPLGADKFILAAVVLGGMAFINIWDFPIYVGLYAATYALRRAQDQGWSFERLFDFISLGLALGVAGFMIYLPFFVGFSSQAGGILPNLINPTRGVQLWVMFGPLFLVLFLFLTYVLFVRRNIKFLLKGLLTSLGLSLSFVLLLALFLWVAASPNYQQSALQLIGASSVPEVLEVVYARRIEALSGWLTMTVLIGMAVAALWPSVAKSKKEPDPNYSSGHLFAFLLILFAAILVFVPEWVYLRDQFGSRMNTIFKFYIQAWLLWGTAGAYGIAVLLRDADRPAWMISTYLTLGVTLVVGLAYPSIGVSERINEVYGTDENPIVHDSSPLTLDGTAHSNYLGGDDRLAIEILADAPLGTLVEAVGGSYTGYARIATHTGMPNLLGWPGHESQWRGGYEEMGNRQTDIDRLYTTSSWAEAKSIIEQYDIKYIYIGRLEYSTYRVNEAKFARYLETIYQFDGVTIYQVPDTLEQ